MNFKCATTDKISDYKFNKQRIMTFQSVLHMLSVTKQLTTETAAQEVNKALIRNKEALPGEKCQYRLGITANL